MQSTLDIDRLHRCVEDIRAGVPSPRAMGRTTALMHLLVGEVELCDAGNLYVVVAHNGSMIPYLIRTIIPMLEDAGIEITHCTKERLTVDGHIQVRFMTPHMFYETHATSGLRITRVFHDADWYALRSINEMDIDTTLARVQASGADIIGLV